MRAFKTELFQNPFQEASWMKKGGWYGMVVFFFLMKGAFWLITPFIIYAFN